MRYAQSLRSLSLYCTRDDDIACSRSFLDTFLDTIDNFFLALVHSSLNLSSSPPHSRLNELFICCVTLFPDVLCSRAISDLLFNGGMSRYSPIPRIRRSSSAFGRGGLALLTELRRRTQPLALSGCQCLKVAISGTKHLHTHAYSFIGHSNPSTKVYCCRPLLVEQGPVEKSCSPS